MWCSNKCARWQSAESQIRYSFATTKYKNAKKESFNNEFSTKADLRTQCRSFMIAHGGPIFSLQNSSFHTQTKKHIHKM